MPTFADYYTGDITIATKPIINRLLDTCHACQEDLGPATDRLGYASPIWAYACPDHVPFLRVAYEPEYLAWLRRDIARAQERADTLTKAVEITRRIIALEREINDRALSIETVNTHQNQINSLMNQIPASLRSYNITILLAWLDECQADVIYYSRLLTRTTELQLP